MDWTTTTLVPRQLEMPGCDSVVAGQHNIETAPLDELTALLCQFI